MNSEAHADRSTKVLLLPKGASEPRPPPSSPHSPHRIHGVDIPHCHALHVFAFGPGKFILWLAFAAMEMERSNSLPNLLSSDLILGVQAETQSLGLPSQRPSRSCGLPTPNKHSLSLLQLASLLPIAWVHECIPTQMAAPGVLTTMGMFIPVCHVTGVRRRGEYLIMVLSLPRVHPRVQ